MVPSGIALAIERICATLCSGVLRRHFMRIHRFGSLMLAGTLAIVLAGCSGVDTRSLLSEPTSVALPRPSISAATPVAVTDRPATQATSVAEAPAEQHATPIPQAAQRQLAA